MTKQTEATPLTPDEIATGVATFQPANADVTARSVWVGETMESHGLTAKGVFECIESAYQLQGLPLPRGMRKASITNAATNYGLWGRTGVAKGYKRSTDGTTRTYADLIGLIDEVRHAHGAKRVGAIIGETLETFQTEIKPSARFDAFWETLTLLSQTVPETTNTTTPDPAAAFRSALKRAATVSVELSEDEFQSALTEAMLDDAIVALFDRMGFSA